MFDGDKNGIVDLQAQTCSCRRFQLEQLSCKHAMIAIHHRKHDVYKFCLDYYSSACWKATYIGVVYPLSHQGDRVIPNEVRENKVCIPDIRSSNGHYRKCWIPYVSETVQRHKCSHCCQARHHRKTCKNLIPLHQNQASTAAPFPSSGPRKTI